MMAKPLGADALIAANAARMCVICGIPASVVCPGQDAEWHEVIERRPDGGTKQVRVLVRAAVPCINLCLCHAAERWPWTSERVGKRRAG